MIIYSGFLGSPEQTETIAETKRLFGSRLVVDPVFADDGELYQTMNDEMVESMKRLCRQADIITPNITEAMFLWGGYPPRQQKRKQRNTLYAFARRGKNRGYRKLQL